MNEKASSDALKNILNQAPRNLGAGKLQRWAILCGIVLSLIVLGKILMGDKDLGGHYVTETAVTGSLVVTVSASGTLQPTTSVDVGSEQSGTLA